MSNNNGFSFEDQQPEETETIGFNIRLEFRGDVYERASLRFNSQSSLLQRRIELLLG
jgi:hypothetical protein